jgi:hypothetical protein
MSDGMKDNKKGLVVPWLRFLVGAPHGRDGCGKGNLYPGIRTHFAPMGHSYDGL